MTSRKKTVVFVALSGGVDSSVAAYLLTKEGYNVTGVFMKNWDACDWHEERRSAEAVAAHLSMPFLVWDFTQEYKRHILSYFYREYERGRTPNPDVLCNKIIKFGFFLDRALQEGADFIATGHYVRKKFFGDSYYIAEARDTNKDQSYFLWTITHHQLKQCFFPLGEYTKHEVRALARSVGLSTYNKKDSQGLCFVGDIQLKDFLGQHIYTQAGSIVNEAGEKLGTHRGLAYFTEGQREGLFLGGQKEPLYVSHKDIKTGTLMVSPKNSPFLYTNRAFLIDVIFPQQDFYHKDIFVKVRYRQKLQRASVAQENGVTLVTFATPQFAVSPGQSLVMYCQGLLIGGGIIDSVDTPHYFFNKRQRVL